MTAEVERVGKRARTIFAITPTGHAALRQWLGAASAPSRFESETMVKILFSPYGTKDELLEQLRRFAAEAAAARAFCLDVANEYLRGADPFPERVHVNALIFRWIWEQAETKTRWADWAIAQVESWSDTANPEAALAIFREPFETPRTASDR